MESSAEPGGPLPKYCSMATALEAPAWAGAAPPWGLSFSCPFALQAPWHTWHSPLTRCASYQPCLPAADLARQGPGTLRGVGDASGTWVLARRGPDGFYYRAQIKTAPELERQGALLVEFEAPLVAGPELPAPRQSVVLGEDVIQFSPPEEHSLQPGDKVLVPWEPDRQRYGPATVLDLEARGPQRASKEEITVLFWNGRTATVPRGGAWGVPPAVWKKAVERLHWLVTSRPPTTLLWAPCCSLLGPGTGSVTHGFPLGTPFLCPPCHPHACCQLLCQGCPGCCPLAGPIWWPLTRTLGAKAGEQPEAELKPKVQPLPLEAPKKEKAPMAVSSSSSSSSEEDLEEDLEVGLPQRLVVDSTVTSDAVPSEKTRRRQADPDQPEWRYWRRNGPEPLPGKPGLDFSPDEKSKCLQVLISLQHPEKQRNYFLNFGHRTLRSRGPFNKSEAGHCMMRLILSHSREAVLLLAIRSQPQASSSCAKKRLSFRYWLTCCSGKGKRCRSIQKEEKGHKKQGAQMAVVGNTKELVLEAANAKPLHSLPDTAEHGKLSQRTTVIRQRHRNAFD